MLNYYNCIKDNTVLGEIDVYTFLDCIKNPDTFTKSKIEQARVCIDGGKRSEYDKIKSQLTCFTLNFSFDGVKSNDSMKKASGFMYLDIDGNTEIELDNPLIFASWLSLSGQGRGVLVKVDNLTLSNFKATYLDIAKQLNINADKHANKATQYCIHSYDENVYSNDDSITYKAITNDETIVTPNTDVFIKKKEDNTVKGVKTEWIYNNIDDFEFSGKPYLFFPKDKVSIAVAYIPRNIPIGSRNQTLSVVAYQIRALNLNKSINKFIRFILNVNSSRCEKPLDNKEVMQIAKKIVKLGDIKPILNKERRVLFNPKFNLTKKEKSSIANKLLGQLKVNKTKKEIEQCLIEWHNYNIGKVTQKKLAEVSKKNIKTIEKYYKHFKDFIQLINHPSY